MYVEGKICDIVSDKAAGCGGTVNRISDYAETAEKQNSARRLLLIVVGSIVVKGKLVNETVNYSTENQAYQFEPEL